MASLTHSAALGNPDSIQAAEDGAVLIVFQPLHALLHSGGATCSLSEEGRLGKL